MAFGPRLLALGLGACVAVAAAAPAGAIFGGTADSATAPLYPEVVAIGYAPPPDLPPEFQGTALQTCVATLVADTVASEARLLTAGHCAAPPDEQLYVSFAADAPPTSSTWTPVPGTVVPQPVSGRDRSDPEDLGVVAIPDSMVPPGITAATLPAAGALSTLRVGEPLTIVGFGCERLAQNGGPHNLRCGTFTRRYTTAPFRALRPSILALNANTAAGAQGGACFADSGGPVFEPDDAPPRAVLATVSGGNPLCNAVGRFYRTDAPTARDFLRSQGIAVP
jgi:hypothetical protein